MQSTQRVQVIPFHAFCLMAFMFSHALYAQNLVPNPGFESYRICPGGFNTAGAMFNVNGWTSPNQGTPDHFHSCSWGEADVPYNWAGVSKAYEGNGYVGIYLWMNTGHDYREYIQCLLTEKLVKDSLYRISFQYKLSSYSMYSIDRIGVMLRDTLMAVTASRPLLGEALQKVSDSALTRETGLWETFYLEYRAKGGERCLVIGNFSNDHDTKSYQIQFRPVQQSMLANSAYYYIDEVAVVPSFIPVPKPLTPVLAMEKTALNTTYILENIHFEFNRYALLPTSFTELDKVVLFLKGNPTVRVELSGHTDDQGTIPYNLGLSRKRAESVAVYLMSKGIGENRVSFEGFGKSKPLVPGVTEEARKINRRVEIRFVALSAP